MTNDQLPETAGQGATSALKAQWPSPATNRNQKRILVVDDEASVTRLLKLNLEHTERYLVRTVNDAQEALMIAAQFRPHLILMDVLMPGIDGGQLASRFQTDPDLKAIPIVFLTAIATKTEVLRGSGRIGGLPFLAKPVNLQEVLDCLDRHLGGVQDQTVTETGPVANR